ncbi:hypothetical protein SASPL_150557 [Salvia splendens]|uniref:Uncharacterized protein n=1 Tax=Salvia splendens TaxID=180675 RepID=A0A8X8Z2K0_SALSN|nr:hypothetical protein SASPL_150557 [Salvia splendens]
MDGNGESKITSIGQIVRFKAFLKKWQLVALTPKSCATMPSKGGACAATSPKISLRLRNSNLHCDHGGYLITGFRGVTVAELLSD